MATSSVIISFLTVFCTVGILYFGLAGAFEVGSPCVAKDGAPGTCVIIQECPDALRWLKARQKPNHVRCGFEDFDEVVCCSSTPDFPGKNDITDPSVNSTSSTTTTEISKPKPREPIIQVPSNRKADMVCDRYVSEMPMPVAIQITGGTEAALGEYPHMVALGYGTGPTPEFQCGGTLISESYVVTAAHCVIRKGNNPPTVARIGVIDLEDTSEPDYNISEIIPHPSYTPARQYDDIALIRLSRPVPISAFAHPACLNTDPEDPTETMFITGWGVTNIRRDATSRYLMKGNVTSFPVLECNATHTRNPSPRLSIGLTEAHICAVDRSFTMDTCWGDSGGPLQLPYTDNVQKIVGITSFGQGCAGGVPGTYARVSSYLDWIESIVWP